MNELNLVVNPLLPWV